MATRAAAQLSLSSLSSSMSLENAYIALVIVLTTVLVLHILDDGKPDDDQADFLPDLSQNN